ncbi:TetR/AcrR family transcriptional regulator [Congregicoccus parvus]|uniref:TetR/AcrR family transcriptional regulator n=1 Tax=Congregicoccus parvus TaxID=3081749 RepID=UPI003FA5D93D
MSQISRKQHQIAERETGILRIAREIVATDGPSALTMERVLARVDFSKGTLYNHFTCREDLIVALHAECFAEHCEIFSRGALFRGRPRERAFAALIGSELYDRLTTFRFTPCATSDILGVASERWREAFTSNLRENVLVFGGIVRDGIAQEDLPEHHDPEQIASSVWSIWEGSEALRRAGLIYRNWPTQRFIRARDDMVATLLDGFSWRPLSHEHDYAASRRRILAEVFPKEAATTGLAEEALG